MEHFYHALLTLSSLKGSSKTQATLQCVAVYCIYSCCWCCCCCCCAIYFGYCCLQRVSPPTSVLLLLLLVIVTFSSVFHVIFFYALCICVLLPHLVAPPLLLCRARANALFVCFEVKINLLQIVI